MKNRFARDCVLCVLACAVGLVTIVGPSSTSAANTLNASDFASADVVESRVVMAQTVGPSRTTPQISIGGRHTCVIDAGAVKCWGSNNFGQLGLGDTVNRGRNSNEMGNNLPVVDLGDGVTATAITAGANHTCAVTTVGVKCWGYNYQGQLGLGDRVNRGVNSNEMGANLPVVNLGDGVTATAITAGENHTCAITNSAVVKCWGLNDEGQLGLGDTVNRGDSSNEMGANLPVVNLGDGVTATAINAGLYHSCAITNSAVVKCWGYNSDGQLGLGDTDDRGDNSNEMGNNLPVVDLGDGVTATAITAGDYHTCAITNSAVVKCWGYNYQGQLGLGDTDDRGDSSNEMGDTLPSSYQFVRITQIITFDALPGREYSASPFTVTATSDSTLAVALTSSTQSVCSVSGFQVTMLTAGTCTLVASQAGGGIYLAAPVVSRSFVISEVSTTTVPVTTTTVPVTTTTVAVTTTTVAVNVSSAPSWAVINALPRALLSTSPMFTSGKITVTHTGFTPGETVQLVVASTPRVIDTGVANASGSVTVTGRLPSSLGAGKHTIALYAPVSGVGFRQSVTITAATLPSTGSNSSSPLGLGALMLLGGVVLMTIRRRASL